eukprot:UN10266
MRCNKLILRHKCVVRGDSTRKFQGEDNAAPESCMCASAYERFNET